MTISDRLEEAKKQQDACLNQAHFWAGKVELLTELLAEQQPDSTAPLNGRHLAADREVVTT